MLSSRSQPLSLGMRKRAQRKEVAQLRSQSRQGQYLSLLQPHLSTAQTLGQRTLRDLPPHCLGSKGCSLASSLLAKKSNFPASKCLSSLPDPR